MTPLDVFAALALFAILAALHVADCLLRAERCRRASCDRCAFALRRWS